VGDSQPTCLTNLKKEHWDHGHEIGVSKFGKEKERERERERESVCVCVFVGRKDRRERRVRVYLFGVPL